MGTDERQSTVRGLAGQTKAMDPEERRRRLRKVYDILLELAEQAETGALDTLHDQRQPTD